MGKAMLHDYAESPDNFVGLSIKPFSQKLEQDLVLTEVKSISMAAEPSEQASERAEREEMPCCTCQVKFHRLSGSNFALVGKNLLGLL